MVKLALVKDDREVPLYQDPFDPVLTESSALLVSDEQKMWIKKVLDRACSDSRFSDKAYIAIHKILTGGLVTPVVTSLNPNNATLGDESFDLHVMGTGFTPESVIVFNSFDEPTTFVSETELTTGVNMPLWAAPVIVPVMVRSAEEVLSNSMNFEFKSIPILLSASAPVKTPVPTFKQEYKEKELATEKPVFHPTADKKK